MTENDVKIQISLKTWMNKLNTQNDGRGGLDYLYNNFKRMKVDLELIFKKN